MLSYVLNPPRLKNKKGDDNMNIETIILILFVLMIILGIIKGKLTRR